MRLLTGWILLLTLLLGGCSRVGLVYNNLGTLVGFEVGRTLDLDRSQEQLLDEQFQLLWDWHRHTQLPLYAQDLRELATAVEEPISAEQVLAYLARAEAHGETLTRRAAGHALPLLASLRDEQVSHLNQRLRKRMEKSADERRPTNEQWVETTYRNARKSLEKWTGRSTPEQREQLRAWAQQRLRWRRPPEADNGNPDDVLEPLNALLAQRQAPDFAEQLDRFLFGQQQDAQDRRNADEQRSEGAAFLAQISQSLTPAQRHHLQDRLLDYARQFEKLAAR
jgi:hypothetical protein